MAFGASALPTPAARAPAAGAPPPAPATPAATMSLFGASATPFQTPAMAVERSAQARLARVSLKAAAEEDDALGSGADGHSDGALGALLAQLRKEPADDAATAVSANEAKIARVMRELRAKLEMLAAQTECPVCLERLPAGGDGGAAERRRRVRRVLASLVGDVPRRAQGA